MSKRKPNDLVPLMLRLPERLRRRIEKSAKEERLSLNAEVIRRIRYSFEDEERSARLLHAFALGQLGELN